MLTVMSRGKVNTGGVFVCTWAKAMVATEENNSRAVAIAAVVVAIDLLLFLLLLLLVFIFGVLYEEPIAATMLQGTI